MSQHTTFKTLTVTLLILMSMASAPSPLYPIYQQRWNFSVSMLTVIFSAYVVGLLGALLTLGSLSDHLGRRPVLVTALWIAAASAYLFWTADGVAALIAARMVQGIAVGTATGAFAAAMVEFEPRSSPGLGATLAGFGTSFGMALGGAVGGVLVDLTAHPDHYLFPALAIGFLAASSVLLFMPEVAMSSPGVLRSLRPTVGVPGAVRATFIGTIPATVAGWAATGLFLAIIPPMMHRVLEVRFAAAGGLSIAALFVAVTLGGLWAGRATGRRGHLYGAMLLTFGGIGLAVSFALGSVSALAASAIPAGLGVGMTFTGNLRELGAVTSSVARSQVFSANYVVSYLALSFSSLLAGFAIPLVGLRISGILYAGGVAALAAGGVVHACLTESRRPTTATAASAAG